MPQGLYKLWLIPLILQTRPVSAATWVNDDAPAISYHGSWVVSRRRGYFDYKDDVHSTTARGDWLQHRFRGTGIEYISEKSSEQGRVEVILDGQRHILNLHTTNFPRLSRRSPLFCRLSLRQARRRDS